MNKNKIIPNPQIIGIGSSAGGLEALKSFFKNMPADKNIAFVIIQHLSPNRKSLMSSLLERCTEMRIQEITDGMKIEPNHVYLNPPDFNVNIYNNKFLLSELQIQRSLNLPIDHFFKSLADSRSSKAICIVLSGTGSDGTLGLKAIKGAGGMCMVQDEKQAEYSGMPHSAIYTGLVDYVLPVEKMSEELDKCIQHPFSNGTRISGTVEEEFQKNIQRILLLIRKNTGHDFSKYKINTIRRRIERRMVVQQMEKMNDYLEYIKNYPNELENLFKDLLINVTNFFRDPEAFQILQDKVIPNIVKNAGEDTPVRAWIAGCGTGEEAYSIAILLAEAMEKKKKYINCQIFASDIFAEAVDYARLGVYSDNITAHVSPERLQRFFIKKENTYQIKKNIREMIVFAVHNFIQDPPFSKVDLLSCRNVLIYIQQELQKELLPKFHYALKQNGSLFLGSSESIGPAVDLFEPIDKKWKLYKRKNTISHPEIKDINFSTFDKTKIPYNFGNTHQLDKSNIQSIAERIILESYSMPCVLINGKYEILYFNGHTDKYLAPPVGKASLNILNMARNELRFILDSLLDKVIIEKSTVIQDISYTVNNNKMTIELTIQYLSETKERDELLLVVFNDKTPLVKKTPAKKTTLKTKVDDERILLLEQELQYTKESLLRTINELEASNEEHKSFNEELHSINEELQSTNEELETSKEETQSTNEELITVNAELQNKIDQLAQANNDINNLLASTEIATIFLNTDLNIKRFTPEMNKLFNLIDSDVGRPISHITSNINYKNIYKDAKHVLETLDKKEKEIQSEAGEWYSVKIIPYRTVENVIDGVVLTFVNITVAKRSQELERLASILNDSNDALTVHDLQGSFVEWNKGAEKMYGFTKAEALKMKTTDIIPVNKKKEALDLLEKVKTGKKIRSFETQRLTKDKRILDVSLTVTKLVDNNGQIYSIATTERDISEEKRNTTEYEKQINELKKQLEMKKK